MKYLVTGGAGFVGSHTCVSLLQKGHQIIIYDSFCMSSKRVTNRISSVSNVMETYYKLTQTPSEMEEELKKELSNQNKQQSGDTSTLHHLTEVVATIKHEIQYLNFCTTH